LTPGRTEPAKPARAEPPSISGPSFLGLSDSSPSHPPPRKRARLSIDPHSAPGGNLEYLLDEEEEPSHWGPGKILFIMIALALALGFGYLRWKTHGFAWLNPPGKKPDATVAQNAPSSDNTPTQPAPAMAPTPGPQPPSIQPAPAPAPTQPAPDASASNTAPSNPPQATTPTTSPAPQSTTKPSDTESNGDNSPAPDKDSTASAEPAAEAPPKHAEKPKPAPKPSIPKPSPVTRPAVAADPVAEAQKYLYGKGVSQDCDRGMRLLKPAANQSNPKAMIEMGALYSAGLCTPHDLPTAYRWFALALRRDPENSAVQADLSKLWSEMTPPERQLAIKLSQ
jgi:hypothetical protein